MLTFALGMLLAGWILVYAGIRNRNPLDEIRGAFRPAGQTPARTAGGARR